MGSNLPLEEGLGKKLEVKKMVTAILKLGDQGELEQHLNDPNNPLQRARVWKRDYSSDGNGRALDEKLGKDRPMLPICPYGCGREGTLLELIYGTDGRAMGIFNDHPCTCVFVADLQMGEPPKPRKMEIGPDGEYHEVEG